ncbi:copper resistance CopC family protein [Nocardioides mangrovi]|uniref:Copper resistance protein CopC n=1 Tax=Nocardioides mangrovi TaxID=2874580 RepID=A0ABS7U9V0_9ACTN|nr:copper resistance CopC family protein [Nocardioides mangrovi]MBZ5737764.1 copper resistance protein CopC [Nocardioides mangrovi]
MRPLRLLLGFVVAGVLVLATGAPASAHASLLKTDPAQGAVLEKAPDQVVLTFNEPVRLDTDFVHGFTADGGDWAVDAVAQDNRVVVTPSGDPGTGTVVVAWKVISADGHIVGGALDFSIGTSTKDVTAAGATVTAAPTSVLVARGIAAGLALAGLLGVVLLTALGRPAAWSDLAWCLGFVGAVLLGPLQQLAHDGRVLGGLTDWVAWLNGLLSWPALLVLLAYLVVGLVRGRGRRAAWAGVPALALVVAAGLAWPSLPQPPAAAAGETSGGSADLGASGTAEVAVHPAGGRSYDLDLTLVDPDGTALTPYRTPTLEVRDDDLTLGDADLERIGAGHYRATVTIPRDGDWTAQVSVRLDEFTNPVAVVPLTVG